ncbi:MAG: transporter substrate-binding domain-containing protein [Gemmatimonadetes bacterium]|nr:transporter substrate-binding domain-containing protein [Gemmatimonadota bacterium]
MSFRTRTLLPIGLIVISTFVQCSQPAIPELPKYTGDLPVLQSHGKLRVIVPPEPLAHIPKQAEPVTIDYDLARDLAAELNLELMLVKAENYAQMVQKLLEGEGDIVAASLTITAARQEQAAFSVPYLYVDEYLITAASDSLPATIEDLAGMKVGVRRSSSHYETLADIQQRVPSLQIHTAPEKLGLEHLLDGIVRGEYQAAVSDEHLWRAVASYYDNLVTSLMVAENRPIALMMRPDDVQLKTRVDEYLLAQQFTRQSQQAFTDDLPDLKERRRLRMITRNNAMTYFIHRGRQVGFEYELIKEFADRHGLRLDIVIPDSHADLLPYLNEGKGDIVAAAMTITEERRAQAAFALLYNEVDELVVVRAEEDSISSLEDLAGRTVHVRQSSSFYTTLIALADSIEGLQVAPLPDDLETEDILAGVEEGRYDITLCDSNLLDVELAYGRQLKAAFSIKPTVLGWAVREDNPALLAALNRYVQEEKGGLFFNMMKKRYFKNKRTITRAKDSLRVDLSGRLSPYDELVKKYARQYGQDWRLITAQMYQESKFDPQATSWVGARGLMQIMPVTGRELGFTDLHDPEKNIHAGVKYLSQLVNRFDPKIPVDERMRFALAAYNVGYGHVLDARRLAREKGWNSDKWFGHVEQAMRLLAKPVYHKRARYGFCRCGQPVHYVGNIQNMYDAYVGMLTMARASGQERL